MIMNTQLTPGSKQPPAPGAEQRAAIWATKCRIALFSGRTGHGQTDYVTYLQMRPPAVEQLAYESFLAGFNIATPAEPSQLSKEITRINSDMLKALVETADQLEDLIEPQPPEARPHEYSNSKARGAGPTTAGCVAQLPASGRLR